MDTIRTRLDASGLDYLSFVAGAAEDREIWAATFQYPLVPGANRLIRIRDAEKITNWSPLQQWLAQSRKMPTSYLLLIANEPDFPRAITAGSRAPLQPHIELIKTRGHIVRCAAPNESDSVAWVRSRAPLDEDTARHLLTRVGGDLTAAAGVCAKLALFDVPAGPAVIDQLCAETPADSFVDNLLARRKREALLAAGRMSEQDLGAAITLIDSRLDLLAGLWRAARAGLTRRDISGVPVFLIRQYQPLAKHYDPTRCVFARRLLAVIDERYRSGARTGVVEALVALW